MNIGIIGMGLIGGSLGKAILRYTSHKVYGYDVEPSVRAGLVELAAATEVLDEEKYAELDMLIIALREGDTIRTLKRVCGRLKAGAMVLDSCGNKRKIAACMENLAKKYPQLHFVGVHPMAGREYSGISAAKAELFNGAHVIAVPIGGDTLAINAVKELYLSIGAKDIEICSAQKHDEMISFTSQLAHILSSSYVKNAKSAQHKGYSAGSFGDLTRVARLNADMWTELFENNSDNLTADIEEVIKRLTEYKNALESGNSEWLHALLEEGTQAKERADNAEKCD